MTYIALDWHPKAKELFYDEKEAEKFILLKEYHILYPPKPEHKKLGQKLFLDKELCDVKIFCEDKTFDCHKIIQSIQSEVFKKMLADDNNMVESTSREIRVTKVSAITMERLLFFLYNDYLDESKITGDLLVAADYYIISDLVNLCVSHLTSNLTVQNAAEVMVSAYMARNEKKLFGEACKFVFKQRLDGKIVEIQAWEKMKNEYPILAFEMMTEAVFQFKL